MEQYELLKVLNDKVFNAFIAGYANPQLDATELIPFFNNWFEENKSMFNVYVESIINIKSYPIDFIEWAAENGWEYKIRVFDDVLWYEPTEDLVRSTKELYSLFLSVTNSN